MDKKTVIIILGVSAALGLGYFGYQVWMSSKNQGKSSDPSPSSSQKVTLPKQLDLSLITYSLGIGDPGSLVKYNNGINSAQFVVNDKYQWLIADPDSVYDNTGKYLGTLESTGNMSV